MNKKYLLDWDGNHARVFIFEYGEIYDYEIVEDEDTGLFNVRFSDEYSYSEVAENLDSIDHAKQKAEEDYKEFLVLKLKKLHGEEGFAELFDPDDYVSMENAVLKDFLIYLYQKRYKEDKSLRMASQSGIDYLKIEGQIVKAVKELNRCLKNCRTLYNLRSKKD